MSSFTKQLIFIFLAIAILVAGGLVIYSATPQGKIAIKPSKTAKLKVVNQENTTSTSNNPVGWWKMDEGTASSSFDSSGNGNTGTLYGGVQWTTGKLGKGLSFDGSDDYAFVSNASNQVIPAGNAAFSISLWFNADSYSTTDYIARGFINHETYLTSGFRFGLYRQIGLSQIRPSFWASQSGGTIDLDPAFGLVNLNTWYHLVVSYTGSSAKMYLNGVEIASDSDGVIVSNTNTITIGYSYDGGGQYWDGLIDDVRIFSRALSAGEVGQMYNSTKDGYLGKIKVSTGLVGYWKLDDNNALTSVIDYSGKANTGTAYSGTATSTSVLSTSTAMVGRAMSFDGGDDYVETPLNNFPDLMTNITIEFWANPSGVLENGSILLAVPDVTTNRINIHFPWGSSIIYWDFGDVNTSGRLSAGWDSAWNNIWAHWVFVSEAGVGQKIYRNNVLLASDANASFFSRGTKTLNIAQYASTYWGGLIDEVKIWNYARTAEQIGQDYQRGLRGLP